MSYLQREYKAYCRCGVVRTEEEREVGLGYISSTKTSRGAKNLDYDHFQINLLGGGGGVCPIRRLEGCP